MKVNFLAISFLILFCSCVSVSANDYTIVGDTVFFEDSNVYLSATPHTLLSSGWVYFNLTSKVYTGDTDVVWGFNTSVAKPKRAELYSPHWINTTTDHKKTFYDPTFYVYNGDDLDYGNFYNINYKYTIIEKIINDNGTVYITSNVSFDSFDINGLNYTICWNTRHDNHYLWKDFSSSFNSIIYDYKEFDKWYYVKDISIISNKNYIIRGWIDVPISTIQQKGKYYFAIKPSHKTISQAINDGHFYNLDPWWNATWDAKKEIILTGNTSGAQTDYQLLLNVTYETEMQSEFGDIRFCNDTHELDIWMESFYDSEFAKIWVEFPTTPENGVTQTYYMYYGNPEVISAWDIATTFAFGDDFTSINAGIWNQDMGTWTAGTFDSKSCAMVEPPSNSMLRAKNTNFPNTSDWIIETSINSTQSGDSSAHPGICFYAESGYTDQFYFRPHSSGNADNIAYAWWDGSTHALEDFTGNFGWNTWHDIKIILTGDNAEVFIDGVSKGTRNGLHYDGTYDDVALWAGDNGKNYYDIFTVRKYASNPPTYTFGNPEYYVIFIPPTPINLTNTSCNITDICWINHTWSSGIGNITDGYNVSINDVWYNTTNTFYNKTYLIDNNYLTHIWQNITVWAYNSTCDGTMSIENVNQNTYIFIAPTTQIMISQIKNIFAAIILTITTIFYLFLDVFPFIIAMIFLCSFIYLIGRVFGRRK